MLNCWTLFSFKTSRKIKAPEVNKRTLHYHVYIGIYSCISIKPRIKEKCRLCIRLSETGNNFKHTLPVYFSVLPSIVKDHQYISKLMVPVPSRAPSLGARLKKQKGCNPLRDTQWEENLGEDQACWFQTFFNYNLSLATGKFRWATEWTELHSVAANYCFTFSEFIVQQYRHKSSWYRGLISTALHSK